MQNDLATKCKILGSIWIDYSDDPEFNEFIRFNDLGLPLAYAYSEDMISVNDSGLRYIEESWNQLTQHPGFDQTLLDDILDEEEED